MHKLKKTYIEITNICNLSCDFCPKTKREPKYMSNELFMMILDRIKGNSEYLYFHVLGEPLMHPQIGLFLDMCNEKGFKVNITTNGTLIERVGPKIIGKPSLRQISFSLHSFEANDNNYPMKVYLDKIFKFINNPQTLNNHIISLRLWNLLDNIDNPNNKYIFELLKNEFDIGYPIEEKLKEKNSLKLRENLYLNQDYKFQWPNIASKDETNIGFCHGLRNQIAILVDGTVVPCCLDGQGIINLGNIKDSTLEEIVSSDKSKNIINGFLNRQVKEELCQKCNYRIRFD